MTENMENKEIHFYEDSVSIAPLIVEKVYPIEYTYASTKHDIETDYKVIHTTSMANMSTALWDKGYDVYLHKNGEVIKIQPKMPELERELRPAHNIFKIWRAGGFDNAFENKKNGITHEH